MSETQDKTQDRTAEVGDQTAAQKSRIAEIREPVTNLLKQVTTNLEEVSGLFESINDVKGRDFFAKKAKQAAGMAGWYDPEAKKQAKIARLKEQLAKLEKELSGETE